MSIGEYQLFGWMTREAALALALSVARIRPTRAGGVAMPRHDDPLMRAAGFLTDEAWRCGLYVCDTIHCDGKEYTVRVKARDALGEQTYSGTIPELLREFDAYAEGCRRRGREVRWR